VPTGNFRRRLVLYQLQRILCCGLRKNQLQLFACVFQLAALSTDGLTLKRGVFIGNGYNNTGSVPLNENRIGSSTCFVQAMV